LVRLARPGNLGLTYDVFMFCITKVSDAIPDRVRKIVLSMRKIVSIPRQSRGLYEGSLARPQYVGRLKAARGYPTRPAWYVSQLRIHFVSYMGDERRVAFCGFNSLA
jgi:hypothetical protein